MGKLLEPTVGWVGLHRSPNLEDAGTLPKGIRSCQETLQITPFLFQPAAEEAWGPILRAVEARRRRQSP